MKPRSTLIAANWKMNPPPAGFDSVDSVYRSQPEKNVYVWVFPPFPYVQACVKAGLYTGAQCGHPEPTGAHTGAVSMAMIKQIGAEFVLCGHSERRKECGETDAFVAAAATGAIDHGVYPVVCIGETEAERTAGKEKDVVRTQLSLLLPLFSRSPRDAVHAALAIAYEPVWAIGTGKTATPEQAQEMHAFIRSLLPAFAQETTSILYGGSVNASNAAALFAQPDIDGALVGGASLKSEEFKKIVEAAI